MWPHLNTTGREFKLTAYTDVAEDYPRIDKDNLDLLRYSPLSLSIISLPYTKDDNAERAETKIPDEVAIFYAGRITPNVGAFIEPILAPEFEFEFAKLSAFTRLGSNTIGLTGGKMDVGGADPYNTIRFTSYLTVNSPAMFSQERAGDFFYFGATDNTGIVADGKFLNNIVYAAVGGFRGHTSDDPIDLYARLAVEYPVTVESVVHVGGFLYDGTERYGDPTAVPIPEPVYESDVTRYGGDFSFQYDSAPHLIDIVGVYMYGEDKDLDNTPGNDVKFDSYYVEFSYFFDRMYGIIIGYDYMSSDEDHSLDKEGPVVNLTYNPWLNTKLALEYANFDIEGDQNNEQINFLVHLYF